MKEGQMERAAYEEIFRRATHEFLKRAGAPSDAKPAVALIEMHGAGSSGEMVSEKDLLSRLFIDSSHFYRIIDIGLVGDAAEQRLFVRASAHRPSSWNDTWDPNEFGPFRWIGVSPDRAK
jgi:hypothetical protein